MLRVKLILHGDSFGHRKDIWGPTKKKREKRVYEGGVEGQRAKINNPSETEGSVPWGVVEPIGRILSGFLKYCYVIRPSEGV